MMKKTGKGDGGIVGPVVDLGKVKEKDEGAVKEPKPVIVTPKKTSK